MLNVMKKTFGVRNGHFPPLYGRRVYGISPSRHCPFRYFRYSQSQVEAVKEAIRRHLPDSLA
jgi:hypothetical protein